jgi:hypothetical protein
MGFVFVTMAPNLMIAQQNAKEWWKIFIKTSRVDVKLYLFHTQQCGRLGISYIPVYIQQCGCKDVSLSIVNSVRVYNCLKLTVWMWCFFLSTTTSIDVRVYPFSNSSTVDHRWAKLLCSLTVNSLSYIVKIKY